jgi:hypothetical protein
MSLRRGNTPGPNAVEQRVEQLGRECDVVGCVDNSRMAGEEKRRT